ncbi:hypothetical protein Tco_0727460 [Tanacetum coccineum]|uniref:DUF4216 domain-containing protein n=1 Tax=Tanacetum coccineum TaxID=301880 RepID=A0ABQ4YIE8_9ASTR
MSPGNVARELSVIKTRSKSQQLRVRNPGGNDGEMYYGQLQEILEFSYLPFKVVLFRVKWFDTRNEGHKVQRLVLRNNMIQILTKDEAFKDDQYIFTTQVKQCFYLEDMARRPPHWKVVRWANINAATKQQLQKQVTIPTRRFLKAAPLGYKTPRPGLMMEPSPEPPKSPKPSKEHGRLPAGNPESLARLEIDE